MVNITKIVQKSIDEHPEVSDEQAREEVRVAGKNKKPKPVPSGPLDQLFGEPRPETSKDSPVKNYSEKLGGLFGVDKESWENT